MKYVPKKIARSGLFSPTFLLNFQLGVDRCIDIW